MRITQILAAGGAFALLAACTPSAPVEEGKGPLDNPGHGKDPSVTTADLCVANACGEKVLIADIPDAENLVFSDDGRLFVSGSENVYEITQNDDGSWATRPLSAETCNFTGLTIQRGHLYASCSGGAFLAAKLDEDVALTHIYDFSGMCLPNGTATGPDGRIYVVDEPLTCAQADPKVVALTLDPHDPMRVVAQDVWIQGSPIGTQFVVGVGNDLRMPNGIQIDGDTAFGTDGGAIYSATFNADFSAGEVTQLFYEPTEHDDLGLVSDGLLVTDFFKGRIFLLDRAGNLLQQTDPGTFVAPTSVRLGHPPMFRSTDILVTDKGIITDTNLPIDHLWLLRRKAD